MLQTATVDYYLVRNEFTLAAGETKTFDVVLTSSTDQRKDTVVVSAGAFGVAPVPAASAITLEGEERKNLASVLADDPLRAVQSLPGVTSNNDFDSEFSLRGAPFNRIGLYLDGVLLHSPFHTTDGQADNGSLTIFNGDTTDDMTLYEGAWPVRYSDRTAGILAVDTREGNRQEMQGRLTASASNAGGLFEGPIGKNKRGSWLVAFRKSYLQYILNRIDFGDQAPMSFGFTDGQARLTYDLTPKHTISLSDVEGASDVNRTPFHERAGRELGDDQRLPFLAAEPGFPLRPQPARADHQPSGMVARAGRSGESGQCPAQQSSLRRVDLARRRQRLMVVPKAREEHAGLWRAVPAAAAGRLRLAIRIYAGTGGIARRLPRHGTPVGRLCAAILRILCGADSPHCGCAPGRVQPESGRSHLAICQRRVRALDENARAT